MVEFAKYYITFLIDFGKNFASFFVDIFNAFANIFTRDIPNYFNDFITAAPNFTVWSWIAFVLVFLLSLAFIFFLGFRLVQLLRRYIFFRAKEVEKDQLLEEIAKQKNKVAKLVVEKNQIYSMKMSGGKVAAEGGQAGEPSGDSNLPVPVKKGSNLPVVSRFAKLSALDNQYENAAPTEVHDYRELNLSQIVDEFINYAASQHKLYYKKDVIRAFFSGMAITKVLILEGISGTGKTSLPYAMGKFFDHPTTICSVQPSWRDRGDLLGYLNEFTKTFNETDFLVSLYEATYRDDPSFIVLDEMNLARIEYYFAEFLSIMEMPDISEWKIDVVATPNETDPRHFANGKIVVPQSLWFVGTANQDDSTFTITDKVYDRTVTIDLNKRADYFDAPLTSSLKITADYLERLFKKAQKDFEISEKSKQALKKIDEYMLNNFKVTFGNRILKQIYNFVPVYMACGGTEEEAIDFMLMSKILRKLSGVNLVFLKKELNSLISLLDNLFGKGKLVKCEEYIRELIRKA